MNKKIFLSLFLAISTTLLCMEEGTYFIYDKQKNDYINIIDTDIVKGKDFREISDKIDNLFAIAEDPQKDFTENDLNSPYINIVKRITHQFNDEDIQRIPHTLLSLAMNDEDALSLPKIKKLFAANIDSSDIINNNLLTDIALKREHTDNQTAKETYLDIATLLLHNNANPNYQLQLKDKQEHHTYTNPAPFMLAVYYKDKKYMQVLLENKARADQPDIAQQYKENKGYWYDHYGFTHPEKIFDMQSGKLHETIEETIKNIQLK
jgi:hypothetical protein